MLTDVLNKIDGAERTYTDLSGWKLLRTEAEKRDQLTKQGNYIQRLKNHLEFFQRKYQQIKKFLDPDVEEGAKK